MHNVSKNSGRAHIRPFWSKKLSVFKDCALDLSTNFGLDNGPFKRSGWDEEETVFQNAVQICRFRP